MSETQQFGSVGVDEATERLIREYFPEYPDSTVRQLLADPQTALTAALLREMRGDTMDIETDSNSRDTARYYADQYTVTDAGPRQDGAEPENVDGTEIDLGFAVDTWDLRFDEDIVVAWKAPNRRHREVKYRASDSPVVGKEARSRYIWVWRADSASADATLFLEGDTDG